MAVYVQIITYTPSIQCPPLHCCFTILAQSWWVVVCIFVQQADAFLSQICLFNIHLSLGMPPKILRKVYSYRVFAVPITGNFTSIEIENSNKKQMFVHLKSCKYINRVHNNFNYGKVCTLLEIIRSFGWFCQKNNIHAIDTMFHRFGLFFLFVLLYIQYL